MVYNKGDIINSLGTIIIFVFFLSVFSTFYDKQARLTDKTSQYELVSEFHANHVNAVITDATQLPSAQKRIVLLLDNLFNETQKIFDDNRNITQNYIVLQIAQLSFKSKTICRFYYHRLYCDPEDFPVLS